MKSVPENIYLKLCPTRFPGAQKCLTPPWSPSAGAEGQQLQQNGAQSPQRQMANAPVVAGGQSLANALVCVLSRFSRARLFVTVWAVAHQAPVCGVLQPRILGWVAVLSSRGIFLTQGIESVSLLSSALAGMFFTTSASFEALANALGKCQSVVGKRIKANSPVLKLCFPTSLPHPWGLWRTVQDALPESESFKSAQEIMVSEFHQWSIFLK